MIDFIFNFYEHTKRHLIVVNAGRIIQNFDHFAESKDREFMCAACNVTGESCVFGSYNRLRVLTYSSRKGAWEESPPKDIENLYTITSLSWRRDGSKIAVVRIEMMKIRNILIFFFLLVCGALRVLCVGLWMCLTVVFGE